MHALDAPILYSQSIIRAFDHLKGYQDIRKGFGRLAQMLFGSSDTVIAEFEATAQDPSTLTVNVGVGQILQLAALESTPYGALPADSEIVYQHGFSPAQQLLFNTAGLSAGQSKWALVQCRFLQVNDIRADDPTNGILGFYNSSNPPDVLQGVGGNGQALPTVRYGRAVLEIIYGNAATTGSHNPPPVSANFVPVYLIELTHGQLGITQGQILVSNSEAHEDAVQAPFAGGLYSHRHTGVAGQAHKIDPATELDGIVPFANLLMTSAYAPGKIPNVRHGSVDPNGVLAGGVDDFYVQDPAMVIWTCRTAGNSSTAVWAPSGPISPVIEDTFPLNVLQTSGTIALDMPSSGAINLPSTDVAWQLDLIRIDANSSVIGTLTAQGGQTFVGGSSTKTINAGDAIRLQALVGEDQILILSEFKGGN